MAGIDFDGEKIDSFFRGVYSDDDFPYIDAVFCDEDRETELKQLLKKQWLELFQKEIMEDKNLDYILYRIHYKINTNSTKKKIRLSNLVKWFSRNAAIFIIPLTIFFGINFFKNINSKNLAFIEIKSPIGTHTKFSLPDGTTGWLNNNSSIKYDCKFNNNRHVVLNGEAFFDVTGNKKRPFKVSIKDINITVLGTRFNVASYENEDIVEVVLERGKLALNIKELHKSLIMKPNDLVVYNKLIKEIKTEVVETNKYVSWTEGKLVFRNDPIEVIARRLERWYDIEIEIIGSFADDIRLHATFVDEDLDEVLNLLKRSLPINYRIENRYIYIISGNTSSIRKKVIITPMPME